VTLRRAIRALPAAWVLCTCHALGQSTATDVPPATEKSWSFSASVYGYLLPDSSDYLQPTATADRGWLHLEARYNYEAAKTGSFWIGYNFSVGKEVTLDFTPMLGGVFGDTTGIAPGYTGSLRWWKLELYSQGEYVIDTRNSSDSFFYTWSELTMVPADWFRFGFVIQRTKLYQTEFDIQRGVLVGFSYKKVDVSAYVFNLDASKPVVVLAASVSF
jgi:hypothetical protein